MKKLLLIAFLIPAFCSLNAQESKKVFASAEFIWYGMDFSKAKFVGEFDQGAGAGGQMKGYDMRTKYIPAWNSLIAKEPQNFDLKRTLDADNIIYDLDPVNTVNSKMDADACMSFNPGKIDKSTISDMIANYPDGEKKQGIGCVFIVENFDKNADLATVYVTFFNVATKKVMFCEKEDGKPGGMGMKNYWAGAIKNILKNIQKDWKGWKKGSM